MKRAVLLAVLVCLFAAPLAADNEAYIEESLYWIVRLCWEIFEAYTEIQQAETPEEFWEVFGELALHHDEAFEFVQGVAIQLGLNLEALKERVLAEQ